MRNILAILKEDIKNIKGSVIGMIVIVGLVIVPVLYAWFNIAGSWDPYGNTGNLKVAVANSDDGYLSDLVPVKVNLGDSVTSALRANDALDWQFVEEDDALEGVKSGDYYAAVVIPKDFSRDMMTIFSTEVKHSQIIYYENQKANAIAPRVTDKGASTIRQQVDETFTKTIGDVGLAATSSLLEFADSDEVANFVGNLSSALGGGVESLRDASQNAGSFAGLLGSASDLVGSAGGLLGKAGGVSTDAQKLLKDAQGGLNDLHDSLGGATGAINAAIKDTSASFDDVSGAIDKAFASATTHSKDTQEQIRAVAGKVGERAQGIEDTAAQVEALKDKVPDNILKPTIVGQLDAIVTRLNALATQQRQLEAKINGAADDLAKGTSDATATHQNLKKIVADARASVSTLKSDYENNLKSQAAGLAGTVDSIADASRGISGDLSKTVGSLSGASQSLAADLKNVGGVLGKTAGVLGGAADDLQGFKDELDQAVSSGDLEKIRSLIGDDPAALADALASPVALDRKPVYHIKNYGSAMAPFYTILSLWVGGIVLAAMMKTAVDDRMRARLTNVRPYQLYLGRFALFAGLSFLQSSLVCLGDVLFFGIQCQSPFLFVLAGWVAGFVFCNIIYTLTVSFGDIGKAVAVVLLVMQVAGSGGTFPIEMTADFFQAVYPFLPFTHGINAMHAAMAGAYGLEYWHELGLLASYLIPSLALGLVFRTPVIKANNWVIEKLEETKLM